jgi:hypothetical protein
MSYEAWGDGDDGSDSERYLEAGWLTPDDADELRDALKEEARKRVQAECALVRLLRDGDEGARTHAQSVLDAVNDLSPAGAWPNELTPSLQDVLGRQCFMFIHLSQMFRLAGFDIPKRAEDEQAFFLHRFLGHWFAHGEDWRDAANADLKQVADRARTAAPSSDQQEPSNVEA